MRLYNPVLVQHPYVRWIIYTAVITGLVMFFPFNAVPLSAENGFDLSDTSVPREKIYHGGPGRDGIPAIDDPKFISAQEAGFLKPTDRVLGINYRGVTRAYPVKILNYHEIVNDVINQQAVVVTYCPLCGSGMAFIPDIDTENNRFGVSGLLYNNDLLLYDQATQSLWSQIMATAISGALKGHKLTPLIVENTTWSSWLALHPDSKVLSTRTGYFRNYNRNPYGDYTSSRELYYPVNYQSARFHPKQRIAGIIINDKAKAYPLSELARQNRAVIKDTFAGQMLTIKYDKHNQSAVISDTSGKTLPATNMFWFAWFAFYPDTDVYTFDGQ